MQKHTTEVGGYWEAVWGSIAGSMTYFILFQIIYFTCDFFLKEIFNYSILDLIFQLVFAVDNIIWLALLLLIFLALFVVLIALYLLARAVGCRCALSWGDFPGAKLTSKYLLRFDLFFIGVYLFLALLQIIQSLFKITQANNAHYIFFCAVFFCVSFYSFFFCKTFI
jgi:hypothetical protein